MMFVPTVIKYIYMKKRTIKKVFDPVNIFMYLILSLIGRFIITMIILTNVH